MAGLACELCLEDTWSRPTNNVYQIRLHLPTTPNLPHPFHPPSLLTKSLYYDHWKSYVFHRLLTVTFLQQPTSSGHGTDTESYHILLHPLLLKTNQQLIKHCIGQVFIFKSFLYFLQNGRIWRREEGQQITNMTQISSLIDYLLLRN